MTPILCDSNLTDLSVDLQHLETIFKESKPDVLLLVSVLGLVPNMECIVELCEEYNVILLEDTCESMGSKFKNKKLGTFGLMSSFSTYFGHHISTIEGGFVSTNDKELYEHVLTLSNHGRSQQQSKEFWPDFNGYKYKMSNVQAAIGCAQLERVELLVERKQEIFFNYFHLLEQTENLSMNKNLPGTVSGYWMPTVVFSERTSVTRDKIKNTFKASNIDARVFFWPLSTLPMFKDCPGNINARSIANRAINLPSFHDITDEEQCRVSEIVKELSGSP